MRALLVILGLAAMVTPTLAASSERDADLDRYFSCLVGQGAVELHYGSTALDAYMEALSDCTEFHAVLVSKNKGDEARTVEDTAHSLMDYINPN